MDFSGILFLVMGTLVVFSSSSRTNQLMTTEQRLENTAFNKLQLQNRRGSGGPYENLFGSVSSLVTSIVVQNLVPYLGRKMYSAWSNYRNPTPIPSPIQNQYKWDDRRKPNQIQYDRRPVEPSSYSLANIGEINTDDRRQVGLSTYSLSNTGKTNSHDRRQVKPSTYSLANIGKTYSDGIYQSLPDLNYSPTPPVVNIGTEENWRENRWTGTVRTKASIEKVTRPPVYRTLLAPKVTSQYQQTLRNHGHNYGKPSTKNPTSHRLLVYNGPKEG